MNFKTIILIFSCLLLYQTAAAEETDSLYFRWALLQVDEASDEIKHLSTGAKCTILQNHKYEVFLWPYENVFVYLYEYDQDKGFTMLFPGTDWPFSGEISTTKQYVPLNPRGLEKIFLIASGRRLAELEEITGELIKNQEAPGVNRTVLLETENDLNKEIKRLIQEHKLSTVFFETPVLITGSSRNNKTGAEHKAVEIKAEDFYAKIIKFSNEK